MTGMNTSIKAYTLDGLTRIVKDLGQPAFRAKQLYEWLYTHNVQSFDEMSNLPAAFRSSLAEKFSIDAPSVVDRQISSDGTRKYLISYEDGVCVETVAIPSRSGDRLTVCFSTQAGCGMACAFCATGREGFTRNLLPGEMVDQILLIQKDTGTRVTNAVGMGQGEPFLNYDNTLAALRILNDPKAVGIGARHISISTCGILPGIEKFATEPEQFTLAVSLHSAAQGTRDLLMPKVDRFKLKNLKQALQSYVEKTNRRVTLEYIMIEGVNDSNAELSKLKEFCSGLHCHVNLIPINAVPDSVFQPSDQETIETWLREIQKHGTEVTLRDSRGSDIDGACGQLKNTYRKNQG